MAGTKDGGAKARETNKTLYGKDYYSRIGQVGGKKGKTGGFWYQKYVANNVEMVRESGRKGGEISRRTKKV